MNVKKKKEVSSSQIVKDDSSSSLFLSDIKQAMPGKVIVADTVALRWKFQESEIGTDKSGDLSKNAKSGSYFDTGLSGISSLRKIGNLYLPEMSKNSTSTLLEVISVGKGVDDKLKLKPGNKVLLEFIPPQDYVLIKVSYKGNEHLVRCWSIKPELITAIDTSE